MKIVLPSEARTKVKPDYLNHELKPPFDTKKVINTLSHRNRKLLECSGGFNSTKSIKQFSLSLGAVTNQKNDSSIILKLAETETSPMKTSITPLSFLALKVYLLVFYGISDAQNDH